MTMALNPDAEWLQDETSPQQLDCTSNPVSLYVLRLNELHHPRLI